MTTEKTKCELCGEPMPEGEEMFKYHGYSGPCPTPEKPKDSQVVGTPLSKLSGRPGHAGHDAFAAIGETWGYG